MSKPKLANLLDDFALGGVSRGLGIFDSAPVRSKVDARVVAVPADAIIAPHVDADIIVTHFPPNWRRIAFLASLRLRNPKARIIHVEHSYTQAWEALKVPNTRRFRTMLSLALRIPHRVICVSEGQAQWLSTVARLPRERLDVIHPYAENPGLATLPTPDFRAPRALRVGAYGRFHEAKGFDLLIKAYKAGLMPGCELILGGFGADEAALRTLADDHPGIRFYGRITDVADFLSGCDLVAVPSRWEAYGQVANEAREAGRPIIVSNLDGLTEQVGDAGMAIDFDDAAAVARAFGGLTQARLEAMSQAARRATYGCALIRQRQWAQLLEETVHPQHHRPVHAFA